MGCASSKKKVDENSELNDPSMEGAVDDAIAALSENLGTKMPPDLQPSNGTTEMAGPSKKIKISMTKSATQTKEVQPVPKQPSQAMPEKKKSWLGFMTKSSSQVPLEVEQDEHLEIKGAAGSEAAPVQNGFGTYVHADGSAYEGNWKDGMRHGQGVYKLHGDVYEGNWENDYPNGKGKYTFSNGETYEGDYVQGRRSGKGLYRYANGTTYEGDYAEGQQHGQGVLRYSSGHMYQGDFVDCKMHGKGSMRYADGRVYCGKMQDGKMHGQGVMTAADGSVIFEGIWERGCSKAPNSDGAAGVVAVQQKVDSAPTPKAEEKTETCGPDSRFYCG